MDAVVTDVSATEEIRVAKRGGLDVALVAALWALAAALVLLGTYFGYVVWSVDRSEDLSTPALRVIESLKDEVRASPNDSELRVRLGEALGAAGIIDEAIEQLNHALEISPTHTGAYLDLGLIAMGEGEWAAAEGYFLELVELSEGAPYEAINQRREVALFHLGEIALMDGRWEDAVSYFKGALRIRKDASDTYLNLGLAYRGLGEEDQAIGQLEIALAFDPRYARAHYELGMIYLGRDDRINAATHIALAAELAPDVDQAQEALMSLGIPSEILVAAQSAFESGELEAALEEILLVRAIDDSLEAALLHARIAEEMDSLEDALDLYAEALELAVGDDDAIALIEEAMDRLSD